MTCVNTKFLLFVFKSINSLLPSRYTNYFTLAKEMYSYQTRGSKDHKLYTVTAQRSARINTLASRGPKYWNSLPTTIRASLSHHTFKASVKAYFCLNMLINVIYTSTRQ